MNERTDYNKHEGNYEKTSEGNYEKTLKLEKKSWLWLFIRYQQLLGILHISHSNNVYVAVGVVGLALVKLPPATF